MPNTAPAGTSLTRTIPRSYTLRKSDFGFSDTDGNAFKAVFFTTLPTAGTLYYDSNGLLGGGRTVLVGNLVQNQFTSARDWPFGSAVSIGLMAVVTVCLWVFLRRESEPLA